MPDKINIEEPIAGACVVLCGGGVGIDYSNGQSNIDQLGIRFGVINQKHIEQAWCDESETIYQKTIECRKCGKESTVDDIEACPDCGKELINEWDMTEPIGFTHQKDGYKCFQSEPGGDIWIEKSLYYTYAQFCSPCSPGACYLTNPISSKNKINKCYCFGPEWFEGEPPYPIYKF